MPTLRTFFLAGKAGRLEALLNEGSPNAEMSALLCHPHPLGGGTMHNKVVYHAMKTLHGLGLPALRFNFRGVERSEGMHDDGNGEQDDVRVALDWLAAEYGKPILFVGFSFGSVVGMRVCCPDERVPGLVALGIPTQNGGRGYEYPWLASCTKPKLFISGGKDQFAPKAAVEQIVAKAGGENQLIFIEEADHFFQSPSGAKLEQMQEALREWVTARFAVAVRVTASSG